MLMPNHQLKDDLENKELKEQAKIIKKANNIVEICVAKTLQHYPHQEF